jgi:hypothetical protein
MHSKCTPEFSSLHALIHCIQSKVWSCITTVKNPGNADMLLAAATEEELLLRQQYILANKMLVSLWAKHTVGSILWASSNVPN